MYSRWVSSLPLISCSPAKTSCRPTRTSTGTPRSSAASPYVRAASIAVCWARRAIEHTKRTRRPAHSSANSRPTSSAWPRPRSVSSAPGGRVSMMRSILEKVWPWRSRMILPVMLHHTIGRCAPALPIHRPLSTAPNPVGPPLAPPRKARNPRKRHPPRATTAPAAPPRPAGPQCAR